MELPKIGFVGLGAMGFAMSTHLVRVGFPVTGYDVYEPTMERWQKACKEIPNSRYTAASSPADAVKSADVVCLMVANHHHVHSALFDEKIGAVSALPKDVPVIIHATIPPTQPAEVRKRLTKEFNRADVKLLDCPVSGGTARSVNGTLTIMASSDDPSYLTIPDVQKVLQNLSSEGRTLYPIPGGLGGGESAKALNQVMCGIHIVGSSEIMGLAAVLGLDTKAFFDFVCSPDPSWSSKKNLGWSWMLENRGPRILGDPAMSSATLIIDKDVGIIRDEEVRLNIELPLLNRASETLKVVMKTDATADDSVIVQHYLGKGSPKQKLVVEQVGKTFKDQDSWNQKLAECHAVIHLNSAYETVRFAQALDLMGPEQKKQWFSIISGAAGGSTTFSEVIPLALRDSDGIEAGFRKYAKSKFPSGTLKNALGVVEDATAQGYDATLLDSASNWLKQLVA